MAPKTKFYITIALSVFGFILQQQVKAQALDTIYLNNQKLACNVKEVLPDAVRYAFPGEDVVNSAYKNSVQKIVFKSGRVQTFSESTSFKPVAKVSDFENVTISNLESEIQGLYKLGEVTSKAKGTTVYSNQERVKQRAYRKLKIQAAMLGANIIYLTNQRTEGNKYGGYFQSGSSAETNLTGIAYSNSLPDLEAFKKLIGSKTDFNTSWRSKLWASDSDVSTDVYMTPFSIKEIINENGIIMIEGKLGDGTKNTRFQLANFTNDTFSIAYKDKSSAYNIVVSLK
ncbi:DUF4156 domain-containing protein [Mucilaginibacter aquatilis]|uniref:DUF4156 domain-containing protein n=1 Tax=Mucilaginibacter aquatilis TaxID=1517760 RepID=A0A6I4IQ36_9SPHI|nr:DUF4156 domain-containing protein [Mucilaginibacter aquatilis]MVN90384.1 DUF4156 domain-containing protein [Mucilaginibacter aquatilis]